VPTYQYACTECGRQLEAVQSFTDEPLVECPECAGRLRKVFSAVGVVFKGSGFYRTDSRSGSASSSEGSTKTESKSESKPDTKSTPATTTATKSESTSSSSSSSTASASAA
jgi:putative FmdB family regulatory protein